MIKVKVDGLNKFLRDMEDAKKVIHDRLGRIIAKYTLLIHGEARRKAAVDTGTMKARIEYVLEELAGEVIARAKYSAFIEFGTGPAGARTAGDGVPPEYQHGSSHGMPPVDALEGWARAHNTDPWAVAVAIMQRGGIDAQPFMRPAFDLYLPKFLREVKGVV